jgi:proteic killer suppression protein
MIRDFADRATEDLFRRRVSRRFGSFARAAFAKLVMIDNARRIEDLIQPPGNRLEKLKGDRQGQWSIRINDRWRICFEWENGNADRVEIVDYH